MMIFPALDFYGTYLATQSNKALYRVPSSFIFKIPRHAFVLCGEDGAVLGEVGSVIVFLLHLLHVFIKVVCSDFEKKGVCI